MTTNNGLTSNKGIVVAACIYHVQYGDVGPLEGFLTEYGLVYASPGWDGKGWDGTVKLRTEANALYWAQYSKHISSFLRLQEFNSGVAQSIYRRSQTLLKRIDVG